MTALRTLRQKGFSFVEMIVVVTIIGIVSSIVIFDRRGFNNSVELTSLTYDIALTLREQQVYGIAVKGYDTGSGLSFEKGYGLNFIEVDNSTPPNPDPSFNELSGYFKFVDGSDIGGSPNFFLDRTSNVPDEDASLVSLPLGYWITFCVTFRGLLNPADPTSNVYCNDSDGSTHDELNISFKRPEPDANFYFTGYDGLSYTNIDLVKATIIVHAPSPSTNMRRIAVYNNGQIAVCRNNTC